MLTSPLALLTVDIAVSRRIAAPYGAGGRQDFVTVGRADRAAMQTQMWSSSSRLIHPQQPR